MNAESAATASWGIEMKACGYDAVVVSGKASGPVYIVVDDNGCRIKDAVFAWGKDAYEAEDLIKQAEGNAFAVASIGQAGERLMRFANVQTAKKSFLGRCGLGAVMGSKNFKAIAVHGTRYCEPAHPKVLSDYNKALHRRLLDQQALKPKEFQISWLGTAMATALFAPQGNLPVKNYSLADFPEGVAKIEGGVRITSRIRAITDAGMVVIGHIGLTPQSSSQLGVIQPYNRRAELVELAKQVPNISAKHEGGEVEVEQRREHPSDILEYFVPKAEVESKGLMPLLLQNYLDKHQSMNLTAQALVRSGTAVVAARNLHK
jgi:hypothetical protein